MEKKAKKTPKTLHVKVLFISLLVVALLSVMEYFIDHQWGDADGSIALVGYLKLLIVGFSIIFFSGRIQSRLFSGTTLSIGVITLFLTGIELTFHLLILYGDHEPTNTYISTGRSFIIKDPNLGYRAKGNAHGVEKILFKDKEVLHATYQTDNLGRRSCINSSKAIDKRYAIFTGCSFTFGSFVNDSQTLPCRFITQDTNYIAYNYGMYGYGTNQLLSLLSEKNINPDITPDDGIFVYTYIDDHVRRTIGDQHYMKNNPYAESTPNYCLEQGGNVKLKGTFENRYLTNFCYRWLNKSNFIQYFNINFPLSGEEDHYKLTGKIISSSCAVYMNNFKNENFYLLIFPGETNKIKNYLSKNVKVLDYSNLFEKSDSTYFIPRDGHPTSKAYEEVAKKLATDL